MTGMMLVKVSVLAASAWDVYGELFIAGGVMIALLVVGYLAIRWMKKHLDPRLNVSDGLDSSAGWTMEEAERMHESGRLSDEEFSVLRKSILGLSPKPEEKDSESGDDDDRIQGSQG